MLDPHKRYLQIAFNNNLHQAISVVNRLPRSDSLIVEAGAPLIKQEGMKAVSALSSWWPQVVADIKVVDGAFHEVAMVADAGAMAATVIGNASTETLDLFLDTCKRHNVVSMIDMLNVADPLRVMIKLKQAPDVVVLHRGRDEETSRNKLIHYKHIARIKSKFECLISAAGGVDLKEAASAAFNGADIVVVNVVTQHDPWKGIDVSDDIEGLAEKFLEIIK